MILRRTFGARCWRGRSFPLSTLREHSDLSAAIFFTGRSICGKSSRRVRCWVTRIIEVRLRVSICAVREAIREAASPVRRATTPLGRSCVTSSASASPGFDSACMKTIGQATLNASSSLPTKKRRLVRYTVDPPRPLLPHEAAIARFAKQRRTTMTDTKTLTKADLIQFTGSEHWYRHAMVRDVLYTDHPCRCL